MPTFLGERLKEQNYNLQKWLLEDVVRLFGIAVSFRDDSRNLTQEEILNGLKQRDKDIEINRKRRLNPKYQDIPSDEKIKKLYEEIKESYEKELKLSIERKGKLLNCEFSLDIIQGKLKDCGIDLVVNLLTQAKKTLEEEKKDVDWSINFYKTELLKWKDFETYKGNLIKTIKTYNENLDKYKKDEEERKKPQSSYTESYQQLIDLITEASK